MCVSGEARLRRWSFPLLASSSVSSLRSKLGWSEVAAFGFGVVGMVLEPPLLPNLLVGGPSQDSSIMLTFPFTCMPDPSHGDKGAAFGSSGDKGWILLCLLWLGWNWAMLEGIVSLCLTWISAGSWIFSIGRKPCVVLP